MMRGKWAKVGGEFVVECRLSSDPAVRGDIARHVGSNIEAWSKAKGVSIVTIEGIAKDYGPGDVTYFRVVR